MIWAVNQRTKQIFSAVKMLSVIAGVLAAVLFSPLAYALETAALDSTRADLQKRIQTSLKEHIYPRLSRFKTKADVLERAVNDACQPGGDGLKSAAVTEAFADSVVSWAGIVHLSFGPLTQDNRNARVAFLPDWRGIVRRQLRRLFKADQKVRFNPAWAAKQSVALQGLTTLEYLLFTDIAGNQKSTDAKQMTCDLARAISTNVKKISANILQDWTSADGWGHRLLAAGPNNPTYLSRAEAAAELAKAVVFGLESVHLKQVLPLQKAAENKKKASRLPFYKAKLSQAYLEASIDAALDLLKHLDLSPYVKKSKYWLIEWLPKPLGALPKSAKALQIRFGAPYTPSDDEFVHVRRLERFSRGLSGVVSTSLGPAAGLTIGFNQLDGD